MKNRFLLRRKKSCKRSIKRDGIALNMTGVLYKLALSKKQQHCILTMADLLF